DNDQIPASHAWFPSNSSVRDVSRNSSSPCSPASAAATALLWRRHSSAKPARLVSGTQICTGLIPAARKASRRRRTLWLSGVGMVSPVVTCNVWTGVPQVKHRSRSGTPPPAWRWGCMASLHPHPTGRGPVQRLQLKPLLPAIRAMGFLIRQRIAKHLLAAVVLEVRQDRAVHRVRAGGRGPQEQALLEILELATLPGSGRH